MSEQSHDHGIESLPNNEIESEPNQHIEAPVSAPEEDTLKVEDIRTVVNQVAETIYPPDMEAAAPKETVALPPANKALKAQTLDLTLRKTRQQLSKPQKAFSKIIHQSQVDAISNVTGKTLGRPMGLFYGGLFALIGSALYLLLSYRYHFAYKYIAFSLFFIGGFIIGLLIELLGKFLKRSKI